MSMEFYNHAYSDLKTKLFPIEFGRHARWNNTENSHLFEHSRLGTMFKSIQQIKINMVCIKVGKIHIKYASTFKNSFPKKILLTKNETLYE